MKIKSFHPIIDQECKILILGTMPGEKSLISSQYYNNPTNQFWNIMSHVLEEAMNVSYGEKKGILLKHHIAIWDVLMYCERDGSLDLAITNEYANNFNKFYAEYPSIKHVYFNGYKPEKYYLKYVKYSAGLKFNTLPSTSATNTSMRVDGKKAIWKNKLLEALK